MCCCFALKSLSDSGTGGRRGRSKVSLFPPHKRTQTYSCWFWLYTQPSPVLFSHRTTSDREHRSMTEAKKKVGDLQKKLEGEEERAAQLEDKLNSTTKELARFSTCERVAVQSPHPVSCTQTRERRAERDVVVCVWACDMRAWRERRDSTIYAVEYT